MANYSDADLLREALRPWPDGCCLIVAPPRTCSTLLARILWGEPSFAAYAHEPFDGAYHRRTGIAEAVSKLHAALDLASVPGCPPRTGRALLLKDLSFQVDRYFRALVEVVRQPITFVIRDPRLSIESRMRKRELIGADPVFPVVESGWSTLYEQVEHCRATGIEYVVVDGLGLRTAPESTVRSLCGALGLDFTEHMLRWSPADDVSLGCTVEEQNRWNERVLSSSTIEPVDEHIPPLSSFPEAGGMREHVAWSLKVYQDQRADPHCLSPVQLSYPSSATAQVRRS